MTAAPQQTPEQPVTCQAGADRSCSPQPPALDSATLLQGGRAVTIRHKGELYRLQTTRQGKLILTK